MRLTTKSEYALLALMHLARNPEGSTTSEISDKYNISKKYLESILKILKNKGYLISKRGYGGGHSLKSAPDSISLAEIVRLMDGPLAPVESVSEYFFAETPISKERNLKNLFKEIRDDIAKKMESTKLQDLI